MNLQAFSEDAYFHIRRMCACTSTGLRAGAVFAVRSIEGGQVRLSKCLVMASVMKRVRWA